MYKILVIVHAGRVHNAMETISFDDLTAAQKAYDILIQKVVSSCMTVIALF